MKPLLLVVFLAFSFAPALQASEAAWVLGKWEMTFDPDGGEKDFLEFHANGDAFSSGPLGEFEGFYVVAGDNVKAVFTYREQDFIMTFRTNRTHDELRIVTSHTGRETIYKKMSDAKKP